MLHDSVCEPSLATAAACLFADNSACVVGMVHKDSHASDEKSSGCKVAAPVVDDSGMCKSTLLPAANVPRDACATTGADGPDERGNP